MGWIEKISGDKERVHYISFNADIRSWFVIKVKLSAEHLFNKALEGTEPFNLGEFGEILLSGLGRPSEKIINEVKRLYSIAIPTNST